MNRTPYPVLLKTHEFIEVFGNIYEHSPWVAEEIYRLIRPNVDLDSMICAMKAVVDNAPIKKKRELLRKHPDLAGRLNLEQLTESSRAEQIGAGLDKCTPEELVEFKNLNNAYMKKFGFPFIFAVQGYARKDVLEAFRERLHHTEEQEFDVAIAQVHRIARLRLENIANET